MGISGGTSAYGKIIKNTLKNARSAKFSTIMLSLLFMIDEFFSCLTVGSIMRPLSDTFKIPRAKLAFLVDSLSSPLVVIVPFSTWIAMFLMQLDKAGISTNLDDKPIFLADPFTTYLKTVPFVFYSFIILITVWFIVKKNISFGLMRTHEQIAEKTGNLFGGKEPLKSTNEKEKPQNETVYDFILPIGSLIFFALAIFLYTKDSFLAFFFGSALSFSINATHMLVRKKIQLISLKEAFQEGFSLMIGSIQILILAWTFSTILKNDLQTGQYIAHLLLGAISSTLFPLIFFIAAFLTSVATGSSWGAFAVMVPVAVPMLATFFGAPVPAALADVKLLLPVLGSIFAGGVAGEHISPIGTTTIMSATSCGSYLQDHIWTQVPYALPPIIGTAIAYLCAGLLINYPYWLIISSSIAIGLIISLGGLTFLNRYNKQNL